MKRTITGSNSSGAMTLGDLREFVASLDGVPDEAAVTARTSLRRRLRTITVQDDPGFRDYIRSVGPDAQDEGRPRPKPEKVRDGGRPTAATEKSSTV